MKFLERSRDDNHNTGNIVKLRYSSTTNNSNNVNFVIMVITIVIMGTIQFAPIVGIPQLKKKKKKITAK